jgi:hypothetical protein
MKLDITVLYALCSMPLYLLFLFLNIMFSAEISVKQCTQNYEHTRAGLQNPEENQWTTVHLPDKGLLGFTEGTY